jgi:hypothetical protein
MLNPRTKTYRKRTNLGSRKTRQTASEISFGVLGASGREESLFLLQNHYWTIRYHGHAASLRSTLGLHYLAVLLRHPGREFHVRELVARPMDVSTPAAAVDGNELVMDELYVGLPVLDARAKAEYKRRINDLRQDLKQAEHLNDPQRQTAVQNELHAIAEHLASSVGLGNRDRKASSAAERARSAVTKCIKRAVQEIAMAIPSLGYQLAASIKTGYFCSYHPDPEHPVAWKFPRNLGPDFTHYLCETPEMSSQ